MNIKTHFWLVAALSLILAACNGNGSDSSEPVVSVSEEGYTDVSSSGLEDALEDYPIAALSDEEVEDLEFMREEEKLARDVYLFLYDVWDKQVFSNIAESEQTHTDAVLELLERYDLEDPAEDNAKGVFANSELQALYDQLVNDGSASLIDALIVGALIEEIDMIDIQHAIDRVEGNNDIVLLYENLMKGSRNHLRAFVKNLDSQGYTYVPSHLGVNEYNSIISSDVETGSQ